MNCCNVLISNMTTYFYIKAVDPPESLSAVCGMVAWQAPSTAQCGLMTGYEVHISLHGKNKTFLVSKKHNQFYHHFFQDGSFLYNSNQNFTAFIKVIIKNQIYFVLVTQIKSTFKFHL